MKPRTVVVLALLVAACGAWFWFVERDLPSSEERAERAKKVFGGLEAPDVEALVLEWDGGKVRLERPPAPEPAEAEESDGESAPAPPPALERTWKIAEPPALAGARADGVAVGALLDALVDLSRSRVVEDVDLAATGLDRPRLKVTVVRGGKAPGEVELAVGAEVPATTSTLVALAGEADAFVVPASFVRDATRPPGDWRDRRLFPGQRTEIERVTLRGGEAGEVVLARRGEEFWLESPIVDRADAAPVDRLLSDLVGLTATSFRDAGSPGGFADLGLDPPAATIEVRRSQVSEPFRVELGASEDADGPSRWARVGGVVFETASGLGDAAARPAGEWQSRGLTGLRMYQVDGATIERGGKTLKLERDGADWKRDGVKIAYTPASEFLAAVADARGEAVLARPEARARGVALDAAELTVTLTPGAGGTAETVTLYPAAAALDGQIPAVAGGRDWAVLLAPETARKIFDDLETLEQAEPLAAAPDATEEEEAAPPE